MARLPLLCLLGAAALSAGLPALGAAVVTPQTGQAAVLFDPRLDRTDLARAAAQAGVSIVRFGAAPGSLVIDYGAAGPAHLRAAGAWLIADPILLGGCAPQDTIRNGGPA